eukprot:1435310-Karenia_brevis.AAC.1
MASQRASQPQPASLSKHHRASHCQPATPCQGTRDNQFTTHSQLAQTSHCLENYAQMAPLKA